MCFFGRCCGGARRWRSATRSSTGNGSGSGVEIDKKSALYCAAWSLLTAQTAYEGWNLFELLCAVKSYPLNMNSVPVKLLQVLTGVVFYGVICGTLFIFSG